MEDYQTRDTMTRKMGYLPPSNKQEFYIKVNGEPFLVDSGLDPNITIKAIQKIQARQRYFKEVEEAEKQKFESLLLR